MIDNALTSDKMPTNLPKRSNLNTPTPRTSTLLQISRVNPIPIVFREIILADDFFQLAMTLNPFGIPQMRRAYFPAGLSLHSYKINYATFSRLYRNPEGIESHSRERVSRSRL